MRTARKYGFQGGRGEGFIGIGAVILLLVAIGISPRIPLPIAIPYRRFDIRVEDILLLGLLWGWLLALVVGPQLYVPSILGVMAIYTAAVVLTTGFGLLSETVPLSRALPYTLKEVEYFLIFCVVANWVHTQASLRAAVTALIGVGVANMLWVCVQLVTGKNRQMFDVPGDYLSTRIFQNQFLLDSYGPRLIGESSPLSTGGLFMVAFLLGLSLLLFSAQGSQKKVWLALSLGFAICTFLSASRTSCLVAVLGAGVLLFLSKRLKGLAFVAVIGSVGTVAVLHLHKARYFAEFIGERWNPSIIAFGLTVRRQGIWKPMTEAAYLRFLTGYGTGSLGLVPGTLAEAHNAYLRVLLESGLFGLLAFLALLATILLHTARLHRQSGLGICKVVSAAALAVTFGISFGALFEDIFTPVVLNELVWVLLGLAAAASRIELGRQQTLVKVHALGPLLSQR